MKKHSLYLRQASLAAAALLLTGKAWAETPQQPNIILFMVDDMGWQDTSEPFWTERTPYNDLCHTPNMERLSRQGVKFTQAYACAISSPTRTSLMTGMNAAAHKVTNWTLNQNTSTDAADASLSFPSWNYNGLQAPASTQASNALYATTLTSILKANNYHNIHVGKAHWGAKNTLGAEPLNLGFDVNIAGSEIGGPGSYYATNNFGEGSFHVPGLDLYHGEDIHLTEAMTLEAIKALNNRPAEKPFYLYMSHYAVHVPIQIDTRFKDNVKYAGMSGSELAYLTMVEGMDKSLGDIMDWVESSTMADNTIIVFMSDNGGHHSIGNITKNNTRYSHNYPLRGSKGSAYEGGVREPMIVNWPGVTTADSSTDEPVMIEDFFPSILEMAGVTNYETVQDLDGISFVPALKSEKLASRDIYWHYPNKWGEHSDGCETYSSIRSGDYKLIYRWGNGQFELYNIKEDIGEKINLLATEEDKAKELAQKLADYLRSVEAQRPSLKSTGKLLAWPDEVKFPTQPVEPQISTDDKQYYYKIKDSRSPQNYWQIDGTGKLVLANEAVANDTTTADKLFKIVAGTAENSYQFYNMAQEEHPISAANTNESTALSNKGTLAIHSWHFTPSAVASGHYIIASVEGSKQLNSYLNPSKFVSFWTPDADNDPGNRWAFTPGYLKEATMSYPNMSRFFTNPTVPWEQAASRYLTSVKVKLNDDEQDLITATSPPLPITGITPNAILPQAIVDARSPQIVLPMHTPSFELTCVGSTDNPRNLQYTQQNVFVDWNQDYDFLDADEAGERNSATTPNAALISTSGYTRTISIPSYVGAGSYRMRLIYHEPEIASVDWKTSIWSNNTIRNGIAYDFEIKIENPNSVTVAKQKDLKVYAEGGYVKVEGVNSFELFNIAGQNCQPNIKQRPGLYIVRLKDQSALVVIP